MTISSFCHDLLRENGPLALDELTRLVVDAGKTTARTPENAVRSAIGLNAVELADGRWASPVQLLEGRWLTTRHLGRFTSSWYDDEPIHTRHDLAPLQYALRAAAIPLAAGGVLQRSPYGLRGPDRWPSLECGPDHFYGVVMRDGVLHVDVVDNSPSLRTRGHVLALAIGRLDPSQRRWSDGVDTVSTDLHARLWELFAAGSSTLTEPAPPLSECVPKLASALGAEWARREEETRHWRPQLDLPAELQSIAYDGARTDDLLMDEWLSTFVTSKLYELRRELEGPAYDERVRRLRGRS